MKQHDLKLLQRYKKLIDISRDIASTLNLELLLDRIVNAATDLTDSQAASILINDPDNSALYFQASSNLQQPILRGIAVPLDNSLAGWIVKNRRPAMVEDPQNDPRFFDEVQQLTEIKTRNLLGVPLLGKDEVIGVLEVINKEDGAFTNEDKEFLSILADQAFTAIQNAKLFAQSDRISEVVHELRTPLTSLNAAANLLLRSDLPVEDHDAIVSIILKESERLDKLTSRFLDLARLESGRMEFKANKIETVLLIDECVEVMLSRMQEKDIHLILEIPENLPVITGDIDRLKQVFLNLLSNAIKYNKPAGKITINAVANENNLIVSVGDTGIGISKENQKKLFTKFYRVPGTETIASGSGLGLSIVQRIVRAHGGNIAVESEVGKGTIFHVHLPR